MVNNYKLLKAQYFVNLRLAFSVLFFSGQFELTLALAIWVSGNGTGTNAVTLKNTWMLVGGLYWPTWLGLYSEDTWSLDIVICVYNVWRLPVAFSECVDVCSLSVVPDERNTTLTSVPGILLIKEQFSPWGRHDIIVYKHSYVKTQLRALCLISPLSFI